MEISKVFDATKSEWYRNYGKDVKCENPYTFFITDSGYITVPVVGSSCGFESSVKAEIARKLMLKRDFSDSVFVVLKNADFTEGRGPMLPDSVFKSAKDAHEYVMQQGGIYGSKQRQGISFGVNIYGGLYCIIGYNGYDIKAFILR